MWWRSVSIYWSKFSLPWLYLGPRYFRKPHFFHVYSRSLSGGFSLVGLITCLLICRCPIVVLIVFFIWLFINPSVSPGQVLMKPSSIDLSRLVVVGLKSSAWRYCTSYGVFVWDVMLFAAISDCFISRGTSCIPVNWLLVPFNIFCPFFWTYIYCLSSMVVHPSSHKTHNDISGDVLIFG